MKNDVKLTSVNILKNVYVKFKKHTIEVDMNLQKIVNRTLDLYTKDEKFKETIDQHKTLGDRNSKY
jgi:hypothetical protein